MKYLKALLGVMTQHEFLERTALGFMVQLILVLWIGSIVVLGCSLEHHWPTWVTVASAVIFGLPILSGLIVGAYFTGDAFLYILKGD